MDNGTGITPVMPIGGYGDSFGGNSFMWIFGLLILLGLFNGNGFGGLNNAIGYDMTYILEEQKRLHDKYKAML